MTYNVFGGTLNPAQFNSIVTSSVTDQLKEIPLLESLRNFQKDVCNICRIPSTLPCKMAKMTKLLYANVL